MSSGVCRRPHGDAGIGRRRTSRASQTRSSRLPGSALEVAALGCLSRHPPLKASHDTRRVVRVGAVSHGSQRNFRQVFSWSPRPGSFTVRPACPRPVSLGERDRRTPRRQSLRRGFRWSFDSCPDQVPDESQLGPARESPMERGTTVRDSAWVGTARDTQLSRAGAQASPFGFEW